MRKKRLRQFLLRKLELLFVGALGAIIGSLSVGYAVETYFSGNQVGYSNSSSGLTANNVQSALDELNTMANLSERVETLESYFPDYTTSQNYTRNPFSGQGLNLGINGETNESPWIDLYANNKNRGSLYYSAGNDATVLTARNSTSAEGTGTLKLKGDTVNVGGDPTKVVNLDGLVQINGNTTSTSGNSSWTEYYVDGKDRFAVGVNNENVAVIATKADDGTLGAYEMRLYGNPLKIGKSGHTVNLIGTAKINSVDITGPTALGITAKLGSVAANNSFYIGKAVFLNFKLSGVNVTAQTNTVVAQVASGYVPPIEAVTTVSLDANSMKNGKNCISWIRQNSGEVVVHCNVALSSAEIKVTSNYIHS